MGKGSSRVLGVESSDPVLASISPLALGLASGTALVIDLSARGGRSLADLISEGPSLDELAPGRSGVAVIGGGGIDPSAAAELAERLARHWPAVVVRPGTSPWVGTTVPVVPLFPGILAPADSSAAVWQPVPGGSRPPGPGPVLPRLRRSTMQALLRGRVPVRSHWISAWKRVWELPWG